MWVQMRAVCMLLFMLGVVQDSSVSMQVGNDRCTGRREPAWAAASWVKERRSAACGRGELASTGGAPNRDSEGAKGAGGGGVAASKGE